MAKYGNVRRGKAIDLADDNFYDSGWERDVARFLNYLQANDIIEGWEYEPQEFSFQGQGYTRGAMVYRPDFVVRYSKQIPSKKCKLLASILDEVRPGETVYIEVKGQETPKDRTKWKRFRALDYNLEVIKRDKMNLIQELFKAQIPYWESNVRP